MNVVCNLTCFLLIYLVTLGDFVHGHGRLIDPTARSTLWRYGIDGAPVNYNDNELFCGGFSTQVKNGYKCGLCGDNYKDPQPRRHENGGVFGKRIIAKTYTQGEAINVSVQITANHKGWFEFKLCPLDLTQPNPISSEDCFDNHLLLQLDGSSKYVLPDTKTRIYVVELQLPMGVTCDQCVLRWRYHTGNSWGRCSDGTGALGCGLQEEFYGCADVTIKPTSGAPSTSTTLNASPTSSTEPSTLASVTPRVAGSEATQASTTVLAEGTTSSTARSGQSTQTQSQVTTSTPEPTPPTSGGTDGGEDSDGEWKKVSTQTARLLKSDNKKVKCVSDGSYKGYNRMDSWCTSNCFHNPPFCPPSHCQCYATQGMCSKYVPLDDLDMTSMEMFCDFACLNPASDDCTNSCQCSKDKVTRSVCHGLGFMAQNKKFAEMCNFVCNVSQDLCPSECKCNLV